MWLFYGYKLLLPVLIMFFSFFIFIKWRKNKVHHGWWLAFLFFSLTLALAIPVKANPFQKNLMSYEKSNEIVSQLKDLTTHNLFMPVILNENVTEQDIKSLEKQLPLVSNSKQKKARKYLNQALEGLSVKTTTDFFVENLNWDTKSDFQLLTKEKINIDCLEEAHKLVDALPDRKEKTAFNNYLEEIEAEFEIN